MKGISPIVAAVLLIAITMTISGVLAYWSSTFVSTTLPSENITTAQCRLAQFEFLNCRYNSSSQNLIFSLNNIRTVDLSKLTAFIEFVNGTVTNGTALNGTLPSGEIRSYTLANIPADFANMIVKTNCPELSRTTTCSR